MKNLKKMFRSLLCAAVLFAGVALMAESGQAVAAKEAVAASTETAATVAVARPTALYWTIAIVMAAGSISAAFAVGKVGAAALGAAAEKPELLGKAIAFVGLGEGIALFGFLISLFLYFKI